MGTKSLRAATYNISKLRSDDGEILTDAIAENIREFSPDILGLNEVHTAGAGYWEDQPGILADRLGYPYRFFAEATDIEGAPYGVALLSKYPLLRAKGYVVPDPEVKDEDVYYETRVVLDAEVEVNGDIFHVLISHFGLALRERIHAVGVITELLPEKPGRTILMGDFNCPPDAPEIAPFYGILKDSSEGMNLLTFSSTSPSIKIDYIFTSDDIRTKDTHTLDESASDHRMLCTTMEWK